MAPRSIWVRCPWLPVLGDYLASEETLDLRQAVMRRTFIRRSETEEIGLAGVQISLRPEWVCVLDLGEVG